MRAKFKECLSCMEEMQGIHSYEIREVCSECGGKALTWKDNEKKRLQQEQENKAA